MNKNTHDEQRIILIKELLNENEDFKNIQLPNKPEEQWCLLRILFNVRMPDNNKGGANSTFLKIQDEFLQEEINQKGITNYKDLTPIKQTEFGNTYLWLGDITTIQCDAIVNAANSEMLGCFAPNHFCIDNAIHTYAGVQLRKECYDIMTAQGHEEGTGLAKITSAYNLPSKYVIHTVGPIVKGNLTQNHKDLLISCYNSCLDIAIKNNINSIAFCCISTGIFAFPKEIASKIAIKTVENYRQINKVKIDVIFNVFSDLDYAMYKSNLNK